jgi:hypothetical protein
VILTVFDALLEVLIGEEYPIPGERGVIIIDRLFAYGIGGMVESGYFLTLPGAASTSMMLLPYIHSCGLVVHI